MHFLPQNYRSRDGLGGTTLYHCPFSSRHDFDVKFRVIWQGNDVTLQFQGKYTPESHSNDKVQRGFTLHDRAAIQQVVHANPLVSSTEIRRNMSLQAKAVKVSPTKSRAVARLTSQARAEVMERYTGGKEVRDIQDVLTSICNEIYRHDV
jgi:hypothetical protein